MRRTVAAVAVAILAAGVIAWIVLLRHPGGPGGPDGPLGSGRSAAAGVPGGPAPRNVVLITIDTLRADHLGCYGDKDARTPAIDRLASEGVLFERASTCVPMTLPSHVSILTGTYPGYHGVHNNGSYRLGDTATTLAEVLRGHGFRTGAIVAAYPLAARFGLTQGFETYDDRLPPERERQIGYREKDAAQVSRAGLAFLDERTVTPPGSAAPPRSAAPAPPASGPPAPFFLWLHYFDPHVPYAPPASFARDFAGRPYDGEIAYVDSEVGKVLERLRRPDLAGTTLVVLMSDHGEGLGEHGEATHGVFLYDSTLHVPLLLSLPGALPAGRRIGAEARTIDVMPTILDLLHLPAPGEVQGRSLLPLLAAPSAEAPREALAESEVPRENYGWSPLAAIRTGGLKYIRAPRSELYDLGGDPGELHDLSGARPGDAARLAAELEQRLAATAHPGAPIGQWREPDDEARERLRSLGYVFAPGPPAVGDLPDPKDRIAVLSTLDEARVLYADGRFKESIATFDKVLLADPHNLTAFLHRGNARLAAGEFREAGDDFAVVLAAHPGSSEALHNLGSALLAQGRLDRAAGLFQQVLDRDPDSPRALESLGTVRARQKRYGEAKQLFEKALSLEPDSQEIKDRLAALAGVGSANPAAVLGQARALYAAGRFDEVVSVTRSAMQAGGDTPDLRFALASALFQLGKLDESSAEYRRVLAARPGDARALSGLALIALKKGRTADAIQSFERSRQADPANPDVQRNLAILYDEAGRDREAIEGYRATLALAPAATEIHFFLGRVYARSGQKDEARAEFQAYLDGGGGEYRDAARAALAKL